MTPGRPVRVTVAVPTYRRPEQLRALLPLVLAQTRAVTVAAPDDWQVRVLVIDNDPDGGAAETVADLTGPDLRYVAESRPGIPAVRNRALDEAAGDDLLVFIDDDERPWPGWLAALLDTWRASGAAVVSGRVVVEPAGELDPWIEAGGFFLRRRMPTGTRVHTASTNNLLVDVQQVRELGIRFSVDVGLAGGEDTLFTRAVTRAGGSIVWCDESVVADPVPASRTTRRWVLTRAYCHGNIAVLTPLRLATGRGARSTVRVRGGLGGATRAVAGTGRWSVGVLVGSLAHQARGRRMAHRGTGMVAGALGIVAQEYARPGQRRRQRLVTTPD
ncbi:glycosyltransferase family 2 protein [Modestobacter sp. VKM Ac-2985]|uniref:glycosyltransferase family 2 protein n=1 Tax=Modestobacter sp. VKM Ac-2985 TaxID=3004139 RepID=UPI0022AB9872|nr:glycosyltransferase [Modestobacter sp. VKM Ac-2985]MCZ2836435.1 glycosyltransferase [Modestobacter sp. VKM Ac-2985]